MSKYRWLWIAACILFVELPVFAHHGFSEFAMDKDVTYTGTVMDYFFINPHVHITVKVPEGASDPSTVGTWDIEAGAPGIMARQGWNKASYKVGDPITLVAHPMKNGGKGASLFYAIRPDGTRLYHDIARPREDDKAPK